mgnify:CR=1 FL=1
MEISTEILASAKTISGAFLILRPHSERRRPRFLQSSPASENGLLKTVQPAKRGFIRKAGQSKAWQRDVNSVATKLALLNTHFSFFARSLMSMPCHLLPLWSCPPPKDSVKNPRAFSNW